MANKDKPENTPAAAPASTVEASRAADALEAAHLREEIAVLKAQFDQMLDRAADQETEIDLLKAAQTGKAATAVTQSDTAAELDAELEGLTEQFKDYPLIEVFNRRALVGLDANTDIRLKGDPSLTDDPRGETCYWHLRWFNFGKEGRAQQAQAEGYMKVRWDDLADDDAITAGTRTDEYVRKGDRGYEVLCKIPQKLYDYKKRRDQARNEGLLSSESRLRDHQANRVASLVSAQGGNADEAGSFVAKKMSVTLTPQPTERFTA